MTLCKIIYEKVVDGIGWCTVAEF